jgi:hypothetical protein
MADDNIRDLMGRYATGSLTADEEKRLFDAALDDQELFDELAREQDVRQLIDEPGARMRLIRALEPPRRGPAWIFGLAATAALTAVLIVVLMRPTQKPAQVAVATKTSVNPEPAPAAPPPADARKPAPEEAKPTGVSTGAVSKDAAPAAPEPSVKERSESRGDRVSESLKDKAVAGKAETPVDQPSAKPAERDAEKKDADQVAVAPPPPPVKAAVPAPSAAGTRAPANKTEAFRAQRIAPAQQNAPGGPRQYTQQNAPQVAVSALTRASAADEKIPPFGFHYSVEIPGHLVIIPGADGYLTVKSSDGAVLYGPKRSAAGIIVDIPVPDAATSLSVTFSANSAAVKTAPAVRTDPQGTVEGASDLVIEIKLDK